MENRAFCLQYVDSPAYFLDGISACVQQLQDNLVWIYLQSQDVWEQDNLLRAADLPWVPAKQPQGMLRAHEPSPCGWNKPDIYKVQVMSAVLNMQFT